MPLDLERRDGGPQPVTGNVPAVLWRPDGGAARGLVLLGHGGYGHKTDLHTLSIASLMATRFEMAVLAIDGPVHGDRRTDRGTDPSAVRDDWRAHWTADPRCAGMVEDWTSALEHVPDDLRSLPLGYIGFSMGTLYGLPLLAELGDRCSWAFVGMWGCDNHTGGVVLQAARDVRAPVTHYLRWDDEMFGLPGTLPVFDALNSGRKELLAQPGGHRPPDEATICDIVARLTRVDRDAGNEAAG